MAQPTRGLHRRQSAGYTAALWLVEHGLTKESAVPECSVPSPHRPGGSEIERLPGNDYRDWRAGKVTPPPRWCEEGPACRSHGLSGP